MLLSSLDCLRGVILELQTLKTEIFNTLWRNMTSALFHRHVCDHISYANNLLMLFVLS